jgi:hypothetical protein
MLTSGEKDYLYEIISSVIGEDHSIKGYRSSFNESTISVVEEMVEANFQCNANMKELIKGLLGGSSRLSKGWLKKLLKGTKKKLSKTQLKGYGCLASVKSRWKTAIIGTTI